MKRLRRSAAPYYHQIEAILRDKIVSGELRVGGRVAPEEELRRMFQVSRSTVRQALQNLERDGLVRREPGRGTFVGEAAAAITDLKMTCLLADLIALGVPAQARVLEAGTVEASRAVAAALALVPGDEAFAFQRLLTVEGQPFSATRIFLPRALGQRLRPEDLAAQHLLKTLSHRCGVEAIEAEQFIEAVVADANQSVLLGVNVGAALLSVSRTSYDRARRPVEYSVTLYRSDRARFFISQRRRAAGTGEWVLGKRGARRLEPISAALPQ